MQTRTEKLRKLMSDHQLKAKDVGRLLGRAANTVRIWRVLRDSSTAREIPVDALELLEFKLKAGEK